MKGCKLFVALIMQTTACVAGVNGKGVGRENYYYDSTVKLRGHVLREIYFEQSYQFKTKLISLFMFLFSRQQWKDEKNALEKEINDLEKKLKGNEENLKKREKEYKKVWRARRGLESLENQSYLM